MARVSVVPHRQPIRFTTISKNSIYAVKSAPSEGDAFPEWSNSLFVGALVDKEVRRLSLHDGKVTAEETLFEELDVRIRDLRQGPDGLLYIINDGAQGKLLRVLPVNDT